MGYRFIVAPEAGEDLARLDSGMAGRIVKKLLWFERQTDPIKWGRVLEGSVSGDIRFRIGDYRAIGVIKGKTITIIKIGHRSSIYR